MIANSEKLTALRVERKYFSDAIPALTVRYNDWLNDSRLPCNYLSNRKNIECEKERANSGKTASGILADIKNVESKIAAIDKEIAIIEAAETAKNQVSVTLANQGISMEALSKAAEGQNEAAKIKAAAEAEAIKTTATTQADNSRNNNMVFIAVAVVVVAVVAFVLFKKFKKKK